MKTLKKSDPEVADLIQKEQGRQENTLMMIPSENIASQAVEEALASSLGNKYAEGYPHKRYYQGNEFVDKVETLAIERAKKLFNVPEANVQALSGSPANFAVYTALLSPGDTIMGLSLSSGGHLTHGAARTASDKYFRSIQYDVGRDGFLDYEKIRKLAKKEKPRLIVAGYTAYPQIIDWKQFASIAKEIGAYLLTDISHIAGLIVAGVYPTPVPYADVIMTTTHKTLRGPRGALILSTKKGLSKDPDLAKKINSAIIPGIQGGPHMNTIAGIGVALKEASKPSFKTYGKQVVKNARALAQELVKQGFELVTGGTTSHLILIDLRNKKLLGNTVAEAFEAAGIVLNRNAVPFDPNPPYYPSGIRLGTPALTSRGMKEKQMKMVARFMDLIVADLQKEKEKLGFMIEDEKKRDKRKTLFLKTKSIKAVLSKVKELTRQFPIKKAY